MSDQEQINRLTELVGAVFAGDCRVIVREHSASVADDFGDGATGTEHIFINHPHALDALEAALRFLAAEPAPNPWAAAAGDAHGTIALLEKAIAQGIRDDRITKPFGDELLEIAKGGAHG